MALPRHAQVAEELRRRIVAGELVRGTALPSEAQLCQEFDLSRGTIRKALESLQLQGLIAGGQGRPRTVLDTAAGQPFESLLSFSGWAEREGRAPGQRTIEVARRGASPVAAEQLRLAEGDPVVDVLRVRLLDGERVMLERSTFAFEVGRLLFDFDPDAGSIYGHLISRGVDLHSARHTFDAVAADPLDADLLGIDAGSPLLRERRRTTTVDGTPLEYADDRYRPDHVTFTIANSQPSGAASGVRLIKESS